MAAFHIFCEPALPQFWDGLSWRCNTYHNAITHLDSFHLDMSTKYHVFTLMFQCQNTLQIGEFDILINNTCTGLHYVTVQKLLYFHGFYHSF